MLARLQTLPARLLRGCLGVLAAAVLTLPLGAGTAGAASWSLSVDVPVQFAFSGDLSGYGAASGYRVVLGTPWYIGVGTERYTVQVNDKDQDVKSTVEYAFTDLVIEFPFSMVHITLGYGTGTAQLQPFDNALGEVGTDEGDATHTLVALGWPLSPRWEVHVSYSRVKAEAKLLVNGVAGEKVTLDGGLHTVGLKMMF